MTTSNGRRRAAIYARISSDRSHEELGVTRQVEDCRKLAKSRGWDVVAEFIDNDLSAYSGKPRPRYEAMCDALKAGDVDAVITWHPDRLHRSPKELEAFIDLIEATGAAVATYTAGDIDFATVGGRTMARFHGVMARHESEHKAERIRRKAQERAEKGGNHGGARPYGYKPGGMKLDPAEARVIRRVAKRILAGESVRSVTADLNRRNVHTARGARWNQVNLRRMMIRPRLAGLREHRGEIIGKAAWPA